MGYAAVVIIALVWFNDKPDVSVDCKTCNDINITIERKVELPDGRP